MRPYHGHITKTLLCTRLNMAHMIATELAQGWEVMYIVPVPQQYPVQQGGNWIPAGQPWNPNVINIVAQPPMDPNYEIGFIHWLEPPPVIPEEKPPEPCPRCNYPYPNPDRMDREA